MIGRAAETAAGLPQPDRGRKEYLDEAGTLYCYDRQSTPIARHAMSCTGYEASRGTA
jgi:hypothetical protein